MMGKRKDHKIKMDGGDVLSVDNPFASLSSNHLPQGKVEQPEAEKPNPKAKKTRVELKRLKSGKGGKTVIEISGLHILGEPGLKQVAKEMKAKLGVGGTVKNGKIEIQSTQFEPIEDFLSKMGYKAIRTGG